MIVGLTQAHWELGTFHQGRKGSGSTCQIGNVFKAGKGGIKIGGPTAKQGADILFCVK
jgi:hypothetical protein